LENPPALNTLSENLKRIRERIGAAAERAGRSAEDVTLVAVAKRQPAASVQAALDAGIRDIAENYVPEALAKFPAVEWPAGTTRHLIGHLQGNKAAAAVELFDMVQSVDSMKLARRLDAKAAERAIILPVLLEVRNSDEPEKTGFNPEALGEAVAAVRELRHLRLRGLMGMAPFTDEKSKIRAAFIALQKHFLTLDNDSRGALSMGMSGDFEIAIEEGSTMVRIGTALFGARGG
jgi:pyridoxal phosphate enzyme (YggS family)